ncbi:hypothetical protein BOTBODRAFT_26598 [Botryobasidium botryosum FD-172 SS1]|uniref:Uncharacterized protein n=1 Tax=Botryobasidium botryosum (strain FD-172 SS1) TaxID=930990 RepID=A0A067MY95_BOTB1|nr:hypothetical protein BOTBODRAFT_26598 [Botryobasidium botryosum FD-172 SS1]
MKIRSQRVAKAAKGSGLSRTRSRNKNRSASRTGRIRELSPGLISHTHTAQNTYACPQSLREYECESWREHHVSGFGVPAQIEGLRDREPDGDDEKQTEGHRSAFEQRLNAGEQELLSQWSGG